MTRTVRFVSIGVVLLTQACSKPGPIAVDEQSPSVVSRTPAPGATNVWIGDPIQVTFSKPIAATSVSDASVSVTGQAGATLGKILALSADRKTLTIQLVENPSVPATIGIVLTSALQDDLNQALVVPSDPWTFSLPAWQEPGAPSVNTTRENCLKPLYAPSPAIRIDTTGAPVVAYIDAHDTSGALSRKLLVKRWDGAGWQPLGGPLNLSTTDALSWPSLAVGRASDLFVSWSEQVDGGAVMAYVKRWDGSSWQQLGAFLNTKSTDDAVISSLAVGPDGDPAVAWQETTTPATSTAPAVNQIYVKHWKGPFDGTGSWSALGSASANLDPTLSAQWPSLIFDAAGAPTVAFYELTATQDPSSNPASANAVYVRTWTSGAWANVGTNPVSGVAYGVSSQFPALVLDGPSGALGLAWWNDSTATTLSLNGHVRKKLANTDWITLGDAIPGTNVGSPAIAFDPSGNPVVAFDENFNGTFWQVSTRRWDGTTWALLGAPLNEDMNVSAFHPTLAIDPAGTPFVAWQEGAPSGGAYDVHVKRYNQR